MPGEAFGTNEHIRISYATSMKELERGLDRIEQFIRRNKPTRLPSVLKEKVWGSTRLSPWFPIRDIKIGEVWFEADLPLLVKFIFTTEKSVGTGASR